MASVDEMLQYFLEKARENTDHLEVGENISTISELKIIFDGYGEDPESGKEDYDNELYAFFIHKDSLKKDFVFPEHETTPWALIHRPDEEICLSAWYSNVDSMWTLPDDWNDEIRSKSLSTDLFENILIQLYKEYVV